MSKYGMADLSSVRVGGKYDDKPKTINANTVVDLFDWKSNSGQWVTMRLFGDIVCTANYWVTTKNRDGKRVRFPAPCFSFNPRTGMREQGKYDPWWEIEQKEAAEGVDRNNRTVQFTCSYYMNAIIRSEVENKPARVFSTTKEKASGFKSKDSNSWTPVRVVRLTKGLITKIQSLKQLNSIRFKSGTIKCFDVSDNKYGKDIMVKFEENADSPSVMYEVHPSGDRAPINEEEKTYLKYDLDTLFVEDLTEDEVRKDFESWAQRMGYTAALGSKVIDEVEDEDNSMFESAPKPRKTFDDGVAEEEEEDEEEDFEPKKKPSKRVVEEDEEDDKDFEDEEEEEEDEPTPKKSSKLVEEEEEEEEETGPDVKDDFEEEEEESTPKKAPIPKKPVAKKQSVPDDDEFDDVFEDDADELWDAKSSDKAVAKDEKKEEEEKPTSKKSPTAKSKKKPAPVEDDDEFDDNFDDDF